MPKQKRATKPPPVGTADQVVMLLKTVVQMLQNNGAAGQQNVSNPQNVSPPRQNYPGFSYMSRISSASFNALDALAENYNDNWDAMKKGTYTFGTFTKTWATTLETCYDVGVAVGNGPSYKPSPQWLLFSYSPMKQPKNFNTPNVLDGVAYLGTKMSQATVLAKTSMGEIGGPRAQDIIMPPTWVDSRRRDSIQVSLDVTEVKKLTAGYYVGFILEQAANGSPPLAVVILNVTA
jgi:hypothetical protein